MVATVGAAVPAVGAAVPVAVGASAFAAIPRPAPTQAGQRLGDRFGGVGLFGAHPSILHAT
jgi:hypothetical protein